jgi:AraC family transcriptional regulator
MDGSRERQECETHARGITRIEATPLGRRRNSVCRGVTVETVFRLAHVRFENCYCGPLHLLVAHERMARRDGETIVDGLPICNRQNLSQTLTFVPAGSSFREWHDPDFPSNVIYIYIDPCCAAISAGHPVGSETLAPRLHFQSAVLWQTVLKVKALVEDTRGTCQQYADALGVVLAHELLHSDVAAPSSPTGLRGGLTAWQRRLVAQYVEDHVAEHIPVSKLAALARLSRYHFCRCFRHSFGVSPHRYLSMRRVERAKGLLAKGHISITEIALDVGFHETSSFTAAFRKLAGQTPSSYRRSLSQVLA